MKALWKAGLVSTGFLTVWGCGPPEVAPALPPGVELVEVIPEDEQAQALGESAGMGGVQPPTTPATGLPLAEPAQPGQTKSTTGGVRYETLKEGTGDTAKPGQQVRVHYVGKLDNGETFDSSRERGNPFSFQLGGGQVIPGWEQGVAGMKVGEVRRLTIPSELGYGAQGSPPKIPGGATLIFEVELLGVQ